MLSRIVFLNGAGVGFRINRSPVYLTQRLLALGASLASNTHLTSCQPFFDATCKYYSTLSLNNSYERWNNLSFNKRNLETLASIGRKNNNPLDIRTNVVNNVLLYKYENERFYYLANMFSAFQLIFWVSVGSILYAFLPKRDPEQEFWNGYVLDNFIIIGTASCTLALGFAAASFIWAFTARSIKYIILNKGGNSVTLVMFHPLKRNSTATVPIQNIVCSYTRKEMKTYLPLKLKGRPFYFILDARGEFVNPVLFDYTVGSLKE